MADLETPYKLIAQFSGTLRWACPFCGLLTRNRVTYGHYWIRCKASTCGQRFLVGFTLHVPIVTTAKYLPPADVVIPERMLDAEDKGVRKGQHIRADAVADMRIWANNGDVMHVAQVVDTKAS